MDIQALIERIEKLEDQIKALQVSSTIPLDIVRSFQGVGFPKGKIIPVIEDPTFITLPYPAKTIGGVDVMDLPTAWFKIENTNPQRWIPVYIKEE